MYRLLLLIGLLISPTSQASAPAWKVHYDKNGLPRCLEHPEKFYESGFLFFWKSNKQYERKVYAVPTGTNLPRWRPHYCSNWKKLIKHFETNPNRLIRVGIPLEKLRYEDFTPFHLPNDILPLLEQVKFGANEPWPNIDDLIESVPEYSAEINHNLTRRFGMKFSTKVFAGVVEKKKENREFKERIQKFLFEKESSVASKNKNFLSGIKIYLANGYLESPNNGVVKEFYEDLQDLQFEVEFLPQITTEDIKKNEKRITDFLTKKLAQGERILIVGASKGAAESLGALSELSKQTHKGSIVGFLGISSTIHGSFLADWAAGIVYPIVEYIIRKIAMESNIPVSDVWPGLYSQTHSYLNKYWKKRSQNLPKNIPYFFVAGIGGAESQRTDSLISRLQKEYYDSSLFPLHSANDGFLEFPDMLVPDSWNLKKREILFQGSHKIMDGEFQGFSLEDPAHRKKIVGSIFKAIAEEIQ